MMFKFNIRKALIIRKQYFRYESIAATALDDHLEKIKRCHSAYIMSLLIIIRFVIAIRRYVEVCDKISSETNSTLFNRLGREYSQLGRAVEIIDEYRKHKQSLSDLAAIEVEERKKFDAYIIFIIIDIYFDKGSSRCRTCRYGC